MSLSSEAVAAPEVPVEVPAVPEVPEEVLAPETENTGAGHTGGLVAAAPEPEEDEQPKSKKRESRDVLLVVLSQNRFFTIIRSIRV